MRFVGRAWKLVDAEGRLINDIDTDQIYHNAYLAVKDINEMGRYALGNLEGYENFASEARQGDIIIAGENFGSGSSRQQAVDCFTALGISCILAKSFGVIYFRNAVNSALPVYRIKRIDLDRIKHLDVIEVDGTSVLLDGQVVGELYPMSDIQESILKAGGLLEYAGSSGW